MEFRLWLENQITIPPQFVDQQGYVSLYRYSKTPKGPTYRIDPQQTLDKRSPYSKNDYRATNKPRTFFYLDINEKEKLVGDSLYVTRFPAHEIYNLITDPLQLKEKAEQQNNGVLNFDYLLDFVEESGFQGIYYNPGFHVVNLFVPVMGYATTEEEVRMRKVA